MQDETITVTIEKLAGLGDGLATHGGKKLFVPFTAPGDVVEVNGLTPANGVESGVMTALLTPGPARVAPFCRHFGVCGGCTLQHISGDAYAAFKHGMAQAAVKKAGYDPEEVPPPVVIGLNARRRAEFGVKQGRVGFRELKSHRLVEMQECDVLEPGLFALYQKLAPLLDKNAGVDAVQVNGTDSGYDVLISAARKYRGTFPDAIGARRIAVRETGKLRMLQENGPVEMRLGGVTVMVPPGAFLQASRVAQTLMTQEVTQGVGDAGEVLDLFAGLGTYSFPLSHGKKVTAVENDALMVDAMRQAGAGLPHFKAERRDLFLNPWPAGLMSRFDAVILNPPRSGAFAQTMEIAYAKPKNVVMVSCNPASFARDAKLLQDAGYRLNRILPIDQFSYSSHLELVAHFRL